jgi:hypothetical protein
LPCLEDRAPVTAHKAEPTIHMGDLASATTSIARNLIASDLAFLIT